MNDKPKSRPGLTREFVLRSILHILEQAETKKEWGSVQVAFQAGVCKTIREEKTITEEK